MHYDIEALSLWLSLGVAMIIGGIQVAGWRHRALIISLISVGAISIIAAIAAPLWPSLSKFMMEATSPSSWLALALFIAALIIFYPGRQQTKASLSSALEERITAIEQKVDALRSKQIDHISTPELRRDLEQQIAEVKKSSENALVVVAQTFGASVNTITSEIARFTDLSATAERQIADLYEQFRNADIDLILLLDFATNIILVSRLEKLIQESPLIGAKNVAAYDDPNERERRRQLFESYIRSAISWLGSEDSLRASLARQAVKDGRDEMERILDDTPPYRRPENVDPLVLRKYTVSERGCSKLVEYLEALRYEIGANIRGYLDGLVSRERLRKDSKMERMR